MEKCGYCGNDCYCKNCSKPYVKWPIKLQHEKTLGENISEGTIIWKNMFKIELAWIIMVIFILIMVYAYKLDTQQCFDILEHPCPYLNQYAETCGYRRFENPPNIVAHIPIYNPE